MDAKYEKFEKTYTQKEIVKVYRAALEEGRQQGVKSVVDTAGELASGFIGLRGLIEGMYKNESQNPISTDEPYSFELKRIDEIIEK
jgi:hypothetical protein